MEREIEGDFIEKVNLELADVYGEVMKETNVEWEEFNKLYQTFFNLFLKLKNNKEYIRLNNKSNILLSFILMKFFC